MWKSADEALAGVPQREIDHHKSIVGTKGCWRCGNPNHRSFKCFASKTLAGTPLPKPANYVAAATTSNKRKREQEESPAPKQQKLVSGAVAVQPTDDQRTGPVWAEETSEDEEMG